MEENEYGSLSVWSKIRLLSEWSPLLGFGQQFLAETDYHKKTLVVADACEWLAAKTKGTTVDDELVSHLAAVLESKEGEALVRWFVDKVQGNE